MPALRIAAVLALLIAACPAPPVEDGGGEGDGSGGENGAGAPDGALPRSVLDPLAGPAIAHAREAAPGGEVRAIVVRADVGIASGESLSWVRVGLVVGPFGLRWFERSTRGITDASHGVEPESDARAGAIARAVMTDAAWLGEEECEALPEAACAALRAEELERAEAEIGGEVRRVKVESVAVIVVTGEGEMRVVE